MCHSIIDCSLQGSNRVTIYTQSKDRRGTMSDLVGMLQSIDWEHAPPAMFRLIEIAMRGIGSAGATFLLGAKGRGEAKKIDAIAAAMQKHSSAPLSLEYK